MWKHKFPFGNWKCSIVHLLSVKMCGSYYYGVLCICIYIYMYVYILILYRSAAEVLNKTKLQIVVSLDALNSISIAFVAQWGILGCFFYPWLLTFLDLTFLFPTSTGTLPGTKKR